MAIFLFEKTRTYLLWDCAGFAASNNNNKPGRNQEEEGHPTKKVSPHECRLKKTNTQIISETKRNDLVNAKKSQ